ncbi:hypothetical protein GN244_ATG20571 [Phytophthora infestans]|uniref:Uncharacterized protein n=1 Tax=Phytophthora infestans TaxID=4787 RepID=A0A833SD56_PHYIN|nr:hypothetical protein GN244_ATG20571 [Phytophthora infestans]
MLYTNIGNTVLYIIFIDNIVFVNILLVRLKATNVVRYIISIRTIVVVGIAVIVIEDGNFIITVILVGRPKQLRPNGGISGKSWAKRPIPRNQLEFIIPVFRGWNINYITCTIPQTYRLVDAL